MDDNVICGTLTELKATAKEGCNYPYCTDCNMKCRGAMSFLDTLESWWQRQKQDPEDPGHVTFSPVLCYRISKHGINETLQ